MKNVKQRYRISLFETNSMLSHTGLSMKGEFFTSSYPHFKRLLLM